MLQAIGKNVIVKIKYDNRYGSLHIPETAVRYKKDFYTAEIVSVGKIKNLKVGDRIIITQYEQSHEGKKFIYEGETYWKVKER